MATKQKKQAAAAKKTTTAIVGSKAIMDSMMDKVSDNRASFTKAFTQGFPQFKQFQQFPQFQPFKMETSMMKGKTAESMTRDASAFGQQQMDAVMKSSTIFVKGMEDIVKTCIEIAQASGEKSSNVVKTMMSCKTINELTEMQSRLAQSSFDECMTNMTKISEMGVKLCTEAMQPINDQMGSVIRRTGEAA